MLKELINNNRSYRRFYQDIPISIETLREMIDCARLSPSARSLQPLKYFLSAKPEINKKIFPFLVWAAHLADWDGPEEGERPSAYIVVLGDKTLAQTFGIDHGIAIQSMLLYAVEQGYGGCIIASIRDRDGLRKILNLSENYEILLVLALGKPKERVIIETLPPSGEYKYWRDDECIHHVPKRALETLILG